MQTMSQQQAIEQAIVSLDRQIRDLELTREALAATLPSSASRKKVKTKSKKEYLKNWRTQ